MDISVLISSNKHPVNVFINNWIEQDESRNIIRVFHSNKDLVGGDILFLISCNELISKEVRGKFKKTLVLHASDLPLGRGWSPHIWSIINGSSEITLSLIEANDVIDSGDIWKKVKVSIPKTALYDEINQLIFDAEIGLMNFAISFFNDIKPVNQDSKLASYWPKRTLKDSEIDLNKSISEQFDLLRVSDPYRFPAFFYKDGKKFKIIITKE